MEPLAPARLDEICVRPERPEDQSAVYQINSAAFENQAEAGLVDTLREVARPMISLVATAADQVVGHIMFSPVTLLEHPGVQMMGLAPMAVAPAFQRHGIGSLLVRAGLKSCAELGAVGVVVLGHPEYYPRFGFSAASGFGLECEYEVPSEVFMAMELNSGALQGHTGTIRYHPAFLDL